MLSLAILISDMSDVTVDTGIVNPCGFHRWCMDYSLVSFCVGILDNQAFVSVPTFGIENLKLKCLVWNSLHY